MWVRIPPGARENCQMPARSSAGACASTPSRVPVLRIYGTADHPAVADEVRAAIEVVRGTAPATMRLANTTRCHKIQSYWMHWPCLLPQHGPGRKHERPIVLTDRQ